MKYRYHLHNIKVHCQIVAVHGCCLLGTGFAVGFMVGGWVGFFVVGGGGGFVVTRLSSVKHIKQNSHQARNLGLHKYVSI